MLFFPCAVSGSEGNAGRRLVFAGQQDFRKKEDMKDLSRIEEGSI
jgi:hypothetical protein